MHTAKIPASPTCPLVSAPLRKCLFVIILVFFSLFSCCFQVIFLLSYLFGSDSLGKLWACTLHRFQPFPPLRRVLFVSLFFSCFLVFSLMYLLGSESLGICFLVRVWAIAQPPTHLPAKAALVSAHLSKGRRPKKTGI